MKKAELAKRLDVTYIPTRATWDQLNQHLETVTKMLRYFCDAKVIAV